MAYATTEQIIDIVTDMSTKINNAGIITNKVTSFNGRNGSVLPMAGDYDATQVNYSAQQTVKQKIDAVAGVWTSAVSCLVGDTTCTVSNSAIHTTSTIIAFCQTSSGDPVAYSNITVREGSAVITFGSALTEAASIKLQILN